MSINNFISYILKMSEKVWKGKRLYAKDLGLKWKEYKKTLSPKHK